MELSPCNSNVALAAALLMLGGCAWMPSLPDFSFPDIPFLSGGDEDRTVELTDDQRLQFESGADALRAGNAVQAEQIFSDLTAQAPDLAAAYANLGTARMMQEQDAAALVALERAAELNPELVQAQIRLGVLYRRAGKYSQAEAAYKAALQAQPDNPYAHLNLGILYDVYLHQPALALGHYEHFQALLPQPDDEVALWITDLRQRL